MPTLDIQKVLLAGSNIFSSGNHAIFILQTMTSFHPLLHATFLQNVPSNTGHQKELLHQTLKAVFVISEYSASYEVVTSVASNDTHVSLMKEINSNCSIYNHKLTRLTHEFK